MNDKQEAQSKYWEFYSEQSKKLESNNNNHFAFSTALSILNTLMLINYKESYIFNFLTYSEYCNQVTKGRGVNISNLRLSDFSDVVSELSYFKKRYEDINSITFG
jgi:hypothetical protein